MYDLTKLPKEIFYYKDDEKGIVIRITKENDKLIGIAYNRNNKKVYRQVIQNDR